MCAEQSGIEVHITIILLIFTLDGVMIINN